MLVLSRRESETILFPSLGITLEVLRIQGKRTRIGIDAPSDIPIVRDEIVDLKSIEFTPNEVTTAERLSSLVHAVCGRLEKATTELNRLHAILDESQVDGAQASIENVFRELQSLEREANDALEDARSAKQTTHAMIVEEDASERKLLESHLRLNNFEVTTASDGEDALDYLSMHAAPDVILLDMMMPCCDGPEFVKKIRADQRFSGMKLFAINGTESDTLVGATGECGVDGWIPKPLDPENLVDTLCRQVDHGASAV